ncbi:MAG TPA: hypothetical protein PLP19_05255 [bacterium]|nr:hypothetical protein [bacterium]HPN42878.1 hypothetical protein [bacterium]
MQTSTIICDAHVHIYPQFDFNVAFDFSIKNFKAIIKNQKLLHDTIAVWLLTEGQQFNFFSKPPALPGYQIEKTPEKESLVVVDSTTGKKVLYILAGRQIVSSDKLEICALGTTAVLPDREMNTQDTITWVLEHDGVPALNWAPGKWFFSRGKIVNSVIDNNSPEQLLISETTMRPTCWSTPVLMKKALNKGMKVLAGSDPLPLPGEEKLLATYASIMSGSFDPANPAKSIKSLLLNPGASIQNTGKRSGLVAFAKRQYGIMRYNKKK